MTRQELERELEDLTIQRDYKRLEIAKAQEELAELTTKIGDHHRKIAKLKRFENLEVSDHAVIRWLERRQGLDVEAIRSEILTDELRTQIQTLQIDGMYKKRLVKGGVIVTVLD